MIKLKQLKPDKEKLFRAVTITFIYLSISPIISFIMTFHPSVSENIDPSYGECNIYTNGVYYPCVSFRDAYFINFGSIIIFIAIMFLGLLFIPINSDERY